MRFECICVVVKVVRMIESKDLKIGKVKDEKKDKDMDEIYCFCFGELEYNKYEYVSKIG